MWFFALTALFCSLLCGCSHQEVPPIQLPEPPPAEEAESLPQPNWVDGEWVYGYVEPSAEPDPAPENQKSDPAPEHQEPVAWPLGQGLVFVYEQTTWKGETWLVAREVESDLCWPLVKEGDFIAALPGGVVYRIKTDSDAHAHYYYHDAATGLRQPLDIAAMWRYAVQDGKLYFSATNAFSCFDPSTGSITHPLPNGADMIDWCLNGENLYYLDSQNGFHRAAWGGEDVLLFYYDAEGLIDMIHLAEMWVADDCLYLYGVGYHYGGWLTSCIPLTGPDVQEEVFWQDRWMSADEYLEAYQKETPSVVMDEETRSAFASVLLDGGTMMTESGAAVTLEERLTPWESVSYVGYLGFAIVDLEQDGVPEVVFQKQVNGVVYYGYDILRYHEGQVQIFERWYRGFRDIKRDGSFHYSGSAFQSGYGRLSFTEEGAQTDTIGLYEGFPDDNGIVQPQYLLGGRPVVEAAFSSFVQAQGQKEELIWTEYTAEELENTFR